MSTKQNFQAIAVTIIIALLGLNGYQWYVNDKLTSNLQVQKSETLELQKIQEELDQDYQAALESLEEMRGTNEQLNALIDQQKEDLRVQKEKINNLIWTKKELDKAKEEIQSLNTNVAKYLSDLQKLKEENKELTSQNQQLTLRVEEEISAKENIILEKNELAQEKEELSKTNALLGSKVDMANAVKINFLEVKGYEIKKNGKIKERTKAKDVQMLRICFLTETNMVTASGTKKFYIRVISPQGETIFLEDNGSGVITNKADNTQVRYTTSGDIDYKNEDTNACMDWSVPLQLVKGKYNVEMFNNGFLVGKNTFTLK
ncbi:MAG: hypothetical protein LC107_00625 [Chitinophagales bacterium]|nr:hypothetical protein [Chitinophagales bacterium]